ncbi:MAG: acetyl ornithine aminotransferase family protein [Anaerolineaceae bacterium]|nr:acetyl ornithine aminotransferase family protein [Anaerolineaceae bacterium]
MKTGLFPGPKAKSIIERDLNVISPSYPRDYPFVMDPGSGSEVWDVDGNRFLDFAAGIAVLSTGHSHPEVVRAIQEQAARFLHISSDFYHEGWVILAENMNRIAPFNEHAISFMSNSGAESVEAAIKLAKHHTGRSQFIAFLGAFHGRTMGALAFTGSKAVYREDFFPVMSGVVHVPYPDTYRPILRSSPGEGYGKTVINYIENEIMKRILPPNDVAGIIVEPIQGEGGYIVPSDDFFPELRKLCDRYGILLIADEVQSGMGRTGKWWAIENFGVEPDIITVAKGVASGIPLGITTARKSIVSWPKGSHGNTFGGNPIACAAANATIDLIEKQYMDNAREVGSFAIDRLRAMMTSCKSIGDVRGIGLMIGVEFVQNRDTRKPFPELRDLIIRKSFETGLLTLGCGPSTIRVAPPLCITQSEMEESLVIFEKAIIQAEKEI